MIQMILDIDRKLILKGRFWQFFDEASFIVFTFQ